MEREVWKAEEASRLLSSELLKEFFEVAESELTQSLFASEPDEADKRERAYQYMQLLNKLKSHLNGYIEGGKLARQVLEELKQGVV